MPASIDTRLLVIGAGPYALSVAALARGHGIETTIVGRPMGFWRDNMPAGMLLRSGPQWHLDAAGAHTLEAYLEHRGIAAATVDPIPVELFLDYAAWFAEHTGVVVLDRLVTSLEAPAGDRFEAVLDDGRMVRAAADRVVLATGYRAELARVPYLDRVLDRIEVSDGFPVLDDAFQTSLDGLYVTGFSATRDFGPFFGFVRGAAASATLIVRDLSARGG